MGVGDGGVVGVPTKIRNRGPASARWNLVVMSEGYLSAELGQFATDAEAFVQTLLATPPFNTLAAAINVYRIDVKSTHSGVDDPAGSCGGTGAVVSTYFDGTFCGSLIPRLLVVDKDLAKATAGTHVPEWHAIVMIVNSTKYGGSGYWQIATCSRHPNAHHVALHELGHSVFSLADEYVDQLGTYTGLEPAQPNIALNVGRAALKWEPLVKNSTPLPTWLNPACSQTRPSPPVPAGTVGAFEGADGYECNLFRPSMKCKMNSLPDPFCPVCQARIRATLAKYLPRT